MTNAEIFSALQALTPDAKFGVRGDTYAGIEWFSSEITKPTEAQIQDEITRQTLEEPFNVCIAESKKRLAASDWSVLPDVNISNKAEFETYRAALRTLMFNPVAQPVYPIEPQPAWI